MYIYQSLHVSGDCAGYAGFIPSCTPDSHPHRITSTKCRINTVVSPDDGHIVARNMSKLININILKKSWTLIWFYLQDYTEIHGKQNIKSTHLYLFPEDFFHNSYFFSVSQSKQTDAVQLLRYA